MRNQNLHKDDINILDNIIKTCIEQNIARPKNLPALGNEFMDDINDIKESEYVRFFKIIQDFNIAEVVIGPGLTYVKPYNIETERFFNQGGFNKLFIEQEKKNKLETLLLEKEINEAVLTTWHRKTYWWTFAIAIIGFLLALASLILTLNK